MRARYLIRLDDACPTMDHERWSRVEDILDLNGIRPLVAVVPNNCDPDLQADSIEPKFWDRVRSWKAKDWTIAMHGYEHLFHYIDRDKLLLPFYDRSEFAGLSLAEQSSKVRASWQIFENENVLPNVWIAPAHCFDEITLEALRKETPISIVSDGIACNIFYEKGFYWLPQQIWSLAPRFYGLWTVCLHPNTMSFSDLESLGSQLASSYYRERIISVGDIKLTRRSRSVLDHIYRWLFWGRIRLISFLSKLRKKFFLCMNSKK